MTKYMDSDQWLDGNSITDYQEVHGYKVNVATSFNSQGNPIMREKLMFGNPLQAYKQTDGSWTDTDEDNIPDIVEIYFSNVTRIENEPVPISDYQFAKDYYFKIKYDQNASNAENWTQKQFNAFVTENNPPIITTLGIETTENWGPCGLFGATWLCSVTTKVTIKVFDVAGINTVKIRLYHWAIIENMLSIHFIRLWWIDG